LNSAVALAADRADLWALRGDAHFALENFGEAGTAYREAIRLEPRPDYYVKLGRTQLAQGATDEAHRTFGQALEINPDDARAKVCQALASLAGKNYDESIAEFTDAISLAGDTPDQELAVWHSGRAMAYLWQNDWDNALADANRTIELAPQVARHRLNRAALYERMGHVEAAQRDREAAAREK
jgi:tetratricopeptide (TPR) repeat protein